MGERAVHRWNYWKATGRLASFLYASGITSNGGSSSYGGGHAPIYRLPRWRDVLPYRLRSELPDSLRHGYMRPYFLWLPSWWWQCHRRQGWKLWMHHRPYHPSAFGICGRCLPCPECGSPELWCGCYG